MARRKSLRVGRRRQRLSAHKRKTNLSSLQRRLRFEPLEDRRLLAVFTVSNLNNSGSGSLRDAIALANSASGPDTIDFASGLSGNTISLTSGELVITDALTIDARPLAANVTINANQLSRIFQIIATTGDFTLGGLTLTGGRALFILRIQIQVPVERSARQRQAF